LFALVVVAAATWVLVIMVEALAAVAVAALVGKIIYQ
jgi:hypothetical protein